MSAPHPALLDLAAGHPVDAAVVDDPMVASAVEHRVAGLLLAAVAGHPHLDPVIRMRLEALDMAFDVNRSRLTRMAATVHEVLTARGIDHLFFKGAVEAHRVFPDPNLRPYADVDVAVAPGASLAEAVGALAPDHPHLDVLDRLAEGGYYPAVTILIEGLPIDVHSEPLKLGRRLHDPRLWWRHTVEIDVPGVGRVRALDDEAAMTTFLLHQARDRFRYLIGFAEYRLRLEAGMDWATVRALAESEGAWEQVSVAAEVMATMLGLEPPLAPSPTWRARAWRRLWGPQVVLAGPEGRSRHKRRGVWLMPLLARGRTLESLMWLVRTAFPPDALLRLKHPRGRGPYLWRILATRAPHLGWGRTGEERRKAP